MAEVHGEDGDTQREDAMGWQRPKLEWCAHQPRKAPSWSLEPTLSKGQQGGEQGQHTEISVVGVESGWGKYSEMSVWGRHLNFLPRWDGKLVFTL